MKILVLELARLGDIYQSWPALRAIKRLHPHSRITVLTRERYRAALQGLTVVDEVKILPSQDMIAPLLEPQFDVKASHLKVSEFVDALKNEKFDWVINFSFSPLSSYLTHAITHSGTKVSGYTRTSDGYLSIPDDMSAYFYAQVGVDRPNRFHLAEIFGTMVQADLTTTDWAPPNGMKRRADAPTVLIHVGASQKSKSINAVKWTTIINQFLKLFDNPAELKIGLIGSQAEEAMATQIMSSVASGTLQNFVGKTDIRELFELIGSAGLVVGADSAPMHMASLTATPCLNLSLKSVNFWETGPRAPRSVILRGADETDFASDNVAQAMRRILMNEKPEVGSIVVQNGAPSYWCLEPRGQDFQWKLVKAIYLNEPFPINNQPLFKDGVLKLDDINRLMIDQLDKIQKGVAVANVASILDRGEEIIQTIAQLVPEVSPLVRWYNTEKVRLGPEKQELLLQKTIEIHNSFQNVLNLYKEFFAEDAANGTLGKEKGGGK